MNISFPKKTQHALLIADHVIRYARVKGRSLSGVEVIEERFLPQGIFQGGQVKEVDTLLTILQECTDAWKLHGRQVVFSLPDTLAIVRRHTIPIDVKDENVRGHLFLELGETLHLPVEQPVFDWHEINRNEKERELLVFAAPEQAVTTLSRLMREVKLKPAAADISSLALYRLYDAFGKAEAEDHTMFLQLSPKLLQVSIFAGELPLVVRTIAIEDGAHLWEEEPEAHQNWQGTEKELEASWEPALVELSKLMNFYQFHYQHGEAAVTNIIVTGDHPYAGLFMNVLKNQIDLPVTLFEETDWQTKQNQPIGRQFYTPIGLALKKEV
jgi:type IV pilus assembly protein PilM